MLNKEVFLTADVMFVDGIPFFISMSRGIKFTTVEYLSRQTKKMLGNALQKIVTFYGTRGYHVGTALMDGDFKCLEGQVPGVHLNTTAASEHVPDIERQIHVVKERARALRSTLPFRKMPPRLII